MVQEEDNKFFEKIKFIFKKNKFKFYSFIIVLIASGISLIFYSKYLKNKNDLIAEKFINAGIYLTLDKKEDAKKIFEEIILNKNKFYSTLSLNKIIEKNLITNEEKILNYFSIVQSITKSKDQKDLLLFKKALYLIKIKRNEEGELLLNKLINDSSRINILAKEIISK